MLICAVLITSTAANACNGISVHSGKYCISKHRMNWYSAYDWCKSQGKTMPTLEALCGSKSSCASAALTEADQNKITENGGITDEAAWVNTSVNTTYAYHVYLAKGATYGGAGVVAPQHHGERSSGCGHGNGCLAICQ